MYSISKNQICDISFTEVSKELSIITGRTGKTCNTCTLYMYIILFTYTGIYIAVVWKWPLMQEIVQ